MVPCGHARVVHPNYPKVYWSLQIEIFSFLSSHLITLTSLLSQFFSLQIRAIQNQNRRSGCAERTSRATHDKFLLLSPVGIWANMPCSQLSCALQCRSRNSSSFIDSHLLSLSQIPLFLSLDPINFAMDVQVGEPPQPAKHAYSVFAIPPEDVTARLKKLMAGLRSEFGGPEFEPHVTVVGPVSLTEDDAIDKFRAACQCVRAYTATVEKVATGTFFYQCVFLLLHPTPQVVEASSNCTGYFGYKSSTPYMPHLSILYGDLSDDEKKKAQEKANILDESFGNLSFQMSSLALYEIDTEDWKKITEFNLDAN